MKYTELEQKIKSMSAKEIILAMVESLKNPVTVVNMDTWGEKFEGVCYGCAATNTICRLGGLDPNTELVEYYETSIRRYARSGGFIVVFEDAINSLRQGRINTYNLCAWDAGFAKITYKPGLELPIITNANYDDPEVLQKYIELANYQDENKR